MNYKVKKRKYGYFARRMERDIYNEYKEKNKRLPFKVAMRTTAETQFGFAERMHQKGNLIDYKGNTYFVKSASQKGLIVEKVRYGEVTKKDLAKPLFIPESEVQKHVQLHPLFSVD